MSEIQRLFNYGHEDYILPGYKVSKTKHHFTKSYSFSPNKDSSRSKLAKDKISFPDPAKYGETLEQTAKKHWRKASGQFPKGRKKTYVDQLIKTSRDTPGPGSYSKLPKNLVQKKVSKMGKFDKSEKSSFMNSVEFGAEETPSSWKYFPQLPDKRIHSVWPKPKEVKRSRASIGPGDYEGAANAARKALKNSPNYSFSRSKTPSVYHLNAIKSKSIPGVGSYKEPEVAYSKFMLKKERSPIIMPYKIKRFTEMVIENSKKVPGPGAYENVLPMKK